METKISSNIKIESFKGKTVEEVEAILKQREIEALQNDKK